MCAILARAAPASNRVRPPPCCARPADADGLDLTAYYSGSPATSFGDYNVLAPFEKMKKVVSRVSKAKESRCMGQWSAPDGRPRPDCAVRGP